MNKLTTSVALCFLITACGGDDDDGFVDARVQFPIDATSNNPDAVPRIDAFLNGVDGSTIDANPACLALANYGSPTLTDHLAAADAGTTFMVGQANINVDIDAVVVELYAGSGVFTGGGITTGTFAIADDDLQYQTCGLCVFILTDVVGTTPSDAGYLATSGSVNISSISENLTVTFTNMTFQHVNIDGGTFLSEPHPDGCTSALTSTTIDAAIVIM